MSQPGTVANQILDVVRLNPECTMEDLIHHFPELPWPEVLYEVQQLSRSGQLRMTESSVGFTTTLRVP